MKMISKLARNFFFAVLLVYSQPTICFAGKLLCPGQGRKYVANNQVFIKCNVSYIIELWKLWNYENYENFYKNTNFPFKYILSENYENHNFHNFHFHKIMKIIKTMLRKNHKHTQYSMNISWFFIWKSIYPTNPNQILTILKAH